MKIAGYARKSVLTDKGDSIESQKKIIADYATRYPGSEIAFYSDEGYTGSNTNRPGYTQLMKDVKAGKLEVLICYRLDRISRNVSDFSQTFELLQKHGVDFVSVREQLDTTSPIGRAMMYICSVFAQMERETIAERIKDSSLELAKSGKWAGGRPPFGYVLERRVDDNGKKYSLPVIDPIGQEYPRKLFEDFAKGYTLSGLETAYRQQNIKSPSGQYVSATTIHQALTNPMYTRCSPEIWEYYKRAGCIMASPLAAFDGTSGVIAYNRTRGSRSAKHEKMPMTSWVIAKGFHEPMIEPDLFLTVQKRFGLNKIDGTRLYDVGLLRGVLRCSCGRLMGAKRKVCQDSRNRTVLWNYACTGRTRQGAQNYPCRVKQVRLSDLDDMVIDALREISIDVGAIEKYAAVTQLSDHTQKGSLERELKACQQKVKNLVARLQDTQSSTAGKYIIENIEQMDFQIRSLKDRIDAIDRSQSSRDAERSARQASSERIRADMAHFDEWEFEQKQNFIRSAVTQCVWDGETLRIFFA